MAFIVGEKQFLSGTEYLIRALEIDDRYVQITLASVGLELACKDVLKYRDPIDYKSISTRFENPMFKQAVDKLKCFADADLACFLRKVIGIRNETFHDPESVTDYESLFKKHGLQDYSFQRDAFRALVQLYDLRYPDSSFNVSYSF